jgi:hypothetical protein
MEHQLERRLEAVDSNLLSRPGRRDGDGLLKRWPCGLGGARSDDSL